MIERWTDHEIQRGFTDWADLCARHNADCDAYEARIAELEVVAQQKHPSPCTFGTLCPYCEIDRLCARHNADLTAAHAELARVKAESLRVVPCGNAPIPIKEIPKLQKCSTPAGAWFRLERWEDE